MPIGANLRSKNPPTPVAPSQLTRAVTRLRRKNTGAPLDGAAEHDIPNYAKDPKGLAIPLDAHIRLAGPGNNVTLADGPGNNVTPARGPGHNVTLATTIPRVRR